MSSTAANCNRLLCRQADLIKESRSWTKPEVIYTETGQFSGLSWVKPMEGLHGLPMTSFPNQGDSHAAFMCYFQAGVEASLPPCPHPIISDSSFNLDCLLAVNHLASVTTSDLAIDVTELSWSSHFCDYLLALLLQSVNYISVTSCLAPCLLVGLGTSPRCQ